MFEVLKKTQPQQVLGQSQQPKPSQPEERAPLASAYSRKKVLLVMVYLIAMAVTGFISILYDKWWIFKEFVFSFHLAMFIYVHLIAAHNSCLSPRGVSAAEPSRA